MNYKHGHYSGNKASGTYSSWAAMKSRCDDPNNDSYDHYGALDISYDPRWNLFENFLADMGERPEGMTLDRLDSNKDYYKENCRWATHAEQTRNSTNTKITLEIAREVKRLWKEGGRSGRSIGAIFGISRQTVCDITKGRLWKDA